MEKLLDVPVIEVVMTSSQVTAKPIKLFPNGRGDWGCDDDRVEFLPEEEENEDNDEDYQDPDDDWRCGPGCCRRPEKWYDKFHPRRIRNRIRSKAWLLKYRFKNWFYKTFEKNEVRDRWYWAFHERPKLCATYTIEHAQDLQAYHGFDAEDELVRMLTEEINKDIIREVWNTSWQSKYSLPGTERGSILRQCSNGSWSFRTAPFWYTVGPGELTLLRELWVPSWDLTFENIQPTGLGIDEERVLLETGICLTPRPRIWSSPSIITLLSRRELATCLPMLNQRAVPLNSLRND